LSGSTSFPNYLGSARSRGASSTPPPAEAGFVDAINLSIRYVDTGLTTYIDQSNVKVNSSNAQRRHAYDTITDVLAAQGVLYADYYSAGGCLP